MTELEQIGEAGGEEYLAHLPLNDEAVFVGLCGRPDLNPVLRARLLGRVREGSGWGQHLLVRRDLDEQEVVLIARSPATSPRAAEMVLEHPSCTPLALLGLLRGAAESAGRARAPRRGGPGVRLPRHAGERVREVISRSATGRLALVLTGMGFTEERVLGVLGGYQGLRDDARENFDALLPEWHGTPEELIETAQAL